MITNAQSISLYPSMLLMAYECQAIPQGHVQQKKREFFSSKYPSLISCPSSCHNIELFIV